MSTAYINKDGKYLRETITTGFLGCKMYAWVIDINKAYVGHLPYTIKKQFMHQLIPIEVEVKRTVTIKQNEDINIQQQK